MAQLEILAGRINALLDGINALLNLETLVIVAAVVVYLLGLLAAISSARDGDWMPLLALVVLIGSSWVVAFLVPSGNILGWVIMLLVLLVLHWLQVYRCPPRMTPLQLSHKCPYPLRSAQYIFILLVLNILYTTGSQKKLDGVSRLT